MKKSKYILPNPLENRFIIEKIKEVYISDFDLKSIFSPKKVKFSGNGNYSFDNLDFFKINLKVGY